jgi:iron complex outermembrane receptor protein
MKTRIGTALLFGSSALMSSVALAQPAPAAPATGEPQSLAEIVVTAQNRAQNVQDVPIRIDVINAAQLEQAGFSDANDLGKVAPVAMIQQDQGTVQVTLRGVGNTAGGSTDNSVVTNIDGEYINTPAALGVALFDLERVEVLRGPQGTLYGRNATGGAVNFIMRKPGDRLGGNVSASYGNYQAVRLDGGVDVPLAQGVGMRFAGFYEDRNGYVKHPGMLPGRYGGFVFPGFAGGRSDDNHAWGGRASLQANEIGGTGLSVYAAAERSKRKFTPQVFTFIDTHQPGFTPGPNCANPGWERTAPAITDQTLCIPSSTNYLDGVSRKEYPAPANGIGRQFWDTTAFRGRIDYKFSPAATLSYIGGWRKFERDPKSTSSLPVVYANLVTNNRTETQSHELRLAGTISGVIYQFGGFYFKEDVENFGGFYLGDITPGTRNFGFYINYNLRDSLNKSKSLFGQVEVPLTGTLTAVGGARYTDNENLGYWRDRAGMFVGPQQRTIGVDQFTNPLFLRSSDDKFTWLGGLNYKPDADTLVYAKISTGFKAGGFDAVGTYGPETNTAYEAGLKKNWGARGRNIFNLTGFYYDYTGLQVDVLLNSAEGGRTFNAGKATNWGVEAETQVELTENDRINLSVNYLHAKLNELSALYNTYCVPISEGGRGNCLTPQGADLTAVGDLDPNTAGIQSPNFGGNRPAYAPRWIITAGYDHEFDLGPSGTLTARANTTFKSKYFTSFLNYPDESQGSFTQTDLSLEYRARWGLDVTAFVRNLENKRPLSQAYFLAAGPDDIWNWQFGTPRTYGLRVSYEF